MLSNLFIKVDIKCMTGDDDNSELKEELGIGPEMEFREGILFLDKIQGIYKTTDEEGCLISMITEEVIEVSNQLEDIQAQLLSVQDS